MKKILPALFVAFVAIISLLFMNYDGASEDVAGQAYIELAAVKVSDASLSSPMIVQASSPVSAGSYESYAYSTVSGQGSATFSFNIKDEGWYVFEANVLAKSTSQNSFYIGIDGKNTLRDENYAFHIPTSGVFKQRTVTIRGQSPYKVYFSPGKHSITFYTREKGTAIGSVKVLLIDDCKDGDGDGYGAGCKSGSDCDDANPSVHVSLNCKYGGNSCGAFEVCALSCPKIPEEQCSNGIDDDCDGQIDESCIICIDKDKDGYGYNCALGEDCDDTNPKVYQAQKCIYDGNSCGTFKLCTGVCPAAPIEACDGVDNDCDAVVDENCACIGNVQESCATGLQGRCASGVKICNSGVWGDCAQSIGPVTEICDNLLDDDCDGEIDEGCGGNAVNFVVQAESGDLSSMIVEKEKGYIYAKSSNTGKATYKFKVVKEGDYVVDVKIRAPSEAANSFYVRLTDGRVQELNENVYDVTVSQGFINENIRLRGTTGSSTLSMHDPKIWHLAPGTYTLEISGREPGTQLDALALRPYDMLCIDEDKDGYAAKSPSCDGGVDCDDVNPYMNPLMPETCGNNIDDNCNELIDEGCGYDVGEIVQAENGLNNGFIIEGGYAYASTVNKGYMEYRFNIAKPGEYYMEVQTLAPTQAYNSFYVGLDGGSAWGVNEDVYDVIVSPVPMIDTVRLRGLEGNTTYSQHDPMVWTLDAGTHIFRFYGREPKTKLDYIVLKPFAADICSDLDGDKYSAKSRYCSSGNDCNDADAAISPGMVEVCFNNIDDNCDARIDENCAVCEDGKSQSCDIGIPGKCSSGTQVCSSGRWGACVQSTYPVAEICDNFLDDDCDGEIDEDCIACIDVDADGYYTNCGAVVDCDDNNPFANPSGNEICGNNIDEDCDGVLDNGCEGVCDTDQDQHDEFAWCVGGGPNDDCDDNNPAIYAGAPEICGNGIDEDCNGQDLECSGFRPGDLVEAEFGILQNMEVQNGLIFVTSESTHGTASYTFYVDTPGQYVMKVYELAVNSGSDSYFVGMDANPAYGNSAYVYDMFRSNTPLWDYVSLRGPGGTYLYSELDPKIWDMAQGEHTFIFHSREANAKIDKLMLEEYSQDVCTDHDNDGYGQNCGLGLDCDDSDYETNVLLSCNYDGNSCYPDSALCISSCPLPPEEICGNGIDEDCDGQDLECSGSTIVLTPLADSYVDEDHPTATHGSDIRILTDAAPDRYETYITFVIPALGELEDAKLRLRVMNYGSGASDNGGTFYAAENTWSESSLNWNNKPAYSGLGVTQGPVSVGEWVDWDVTSLIFHSGEFSFALIPESNNGADYYSRESSNKPELVLTYSPNNESCTDNDGDNYYVNCGINFDCNDNNPDIYPGALEICGNGIDEDCDGQDILCSNIPPMVALLTPPNGSVFNQSTNITISASATDPDGSIVKVEFYRNDILLGMDTTIPYMYAWNNAGLGTHFLTAKAYDNNNATASSQPIIVIVTSSYCTLGQTRLCSTGLLGACAQGTQACTINSEWGACVAPTPQPEICGNNIDEDCDGVLDNGCEGVCDTDQDQHDEFAWCVGGGPNDDCNDNDPTIYPGHTELCDGKDNNCNGQVDEGCVNEYGVQRTFSQNSVQQGQTLNVTLHVAIGNPAVQTYYSIEEFVPQGWTVTNSGGGGTQFDGILKWALMAQAESTTYTYSVQAPQISDNHTFYGQYFIQGAPQVSSTGGSNTISVVPPPLQCTSGQTRSCSTGFYGICAQGTQTCTANGEWGTCIAPAPQTEICIGGIDEDCDEYIDCNDPNCYADPACQSSFCGDGTCNGGETCSSCAQDCGSCGNGIVAVVAADIAYSNNNDAATAALATAVNPDIVIVPGDLAYNDGTLAQFNSYYHPTWGQFYDITYPAPGNHEYRTANAQGYFDYWANRYASLGITGTHYSIDIGNWHIISLTDSVGSSQRNAQAQWLEQDLANTNKPCILAFTHRPGFSSNDHGDQIGIVGVFWDKLYAANTDIMLAGHDHGYERFIPINPQGEADPNGMAEFVVGSGGKSLYTFGTIKSTSATHYKGYGILKMTLYLDSYDFEFISVNGDYTDSGSGVCHGAGGA